MLLKTALWYLNKNCEVFPKFPCFTCLTFNGQEQQHPLLFERLLSFPTISPFALD